MQIEKINENQLQIILKTEDLKNNNISIHSFMCNSSDSQNLFLSILNFANHEYGFDLINHEIIIEAYAIPSQNVFVLVITRVQKSKKLHPVKNQRNKFKFNKSFFLKFNNFDDFCIFCNSLKLNLKQQSTLYLLDNCYFLHIKFNKLKDYLRILAIANEFSNEIYSDCFIIDENAETIIKNCAIEMCRKYFV